MRRELCHLETAAEYCHRLDAELIDRMRKRAESQERRARLAQVSPVHETAILDALENLGYEENTVKLLFLVPMVQVAWSDGFVSQAERDRIIAIASLRGVEADTPAFQRLQGWLDRRPPDQFFQGTLGVIHAIFGSMPLNARKVCREALLLCCREVAIAAGGLFGWKTKICAAERKLIEEISKRLEPDRQAVA